MELPGEAAALPAPPPAASTAEGAAPAVGGGAGGGAAAAGTSALARLQIGALESRLRAQADLVRSYQLALAQVGAWAAAAAAGGHLAPTSRSIGERFIGNHRRYPSLARDWPAP